MSVRIRDKRKAPTLKCFKILGARQKWRCNMCHYLLKSTCQVDHKVPLAFGGSNDLSNLQLLCCSCHCEKTQVETDSLCEYKYDYVCNKSKTVLTCLLCKLKISPYFAVQHKKSHHQQVLTQSGVIPARSAQCVLDPGVVS